MIFKQAHKIVTKYGWYRNAPYKDGVERQSWKHPLYLLSIQFIEGKNKHYWKDVAIKNLSEKEIEYFQGGLK